MYKQNKRNRKAFLCPSCGQNSISIQKEQDYALIICSNGMCDVKVNYKIKTNRFSENIDIYGDFIDLFKMDSEINRINSKINSIIKNELELKELNHYLLIIIDLIGKKARFESDSIIKQQLKDKINEYEIKRMETSNKIKDLKDIDPNLISRDSKEKSQIKKYKSIEEVFGEDKKGFLEF